MKQVILDSLPYKKLLNYLEIITKKELILLKKHFYFLLILLKIINYPIYKKLLILHFNNLLYFI